MTRVITYGTFDLFHYGHLEILRRARELGDYLIVAVSTDEFVSRDKGKHCYYSYQHRSAIVRAIRHVNQVIPEHCWQQKRHDVKKHGVDIFVMGDDWRGKFDKELDGLCKVVYLPRTPAISSTLIKQKAARQPPD